MGHSLAGHRAGVAVIADEAAHDGSVLLLNPGLVVLAVRPGAGELDSRSLHQPISVSLMKALSLSESMPLMEKGSCRPIATSYQPFHHQGLLAGRQRKGFGPTGADAGCHQAVDEGPR